MDLKRNANTSKYARQIFQAMRPVFADLVAEIQRSIGFYSSVHRESRIKKVLALGGTFRLAGLQKYLQQNLQLEVDKLNELTAGAPTDAKLAATFNQNLLSLVSAYGLAIQAMGQSKITSSLLPMKIRRAKMWRDKTKWFGAAAAIFVLGAGMSLLGYYLRDLEFKNAAETRDTRIDPVLRQATDLSSQWKDKVEGNGSSDRLTIQNVRSMLDGRGLWIDLLGEIFSALPPAPEGYPSEAYLKSHPRPMREIVLIDKIESAYYPDLLLGLAGAPPELGMATPASAGQPASDPAIPSGSRGFILTISITTPHRDGFLYALQSFIPNLRKFDRAAMDKWNADNPKNRRDFYIAKVSAPMQQIQIKNDPIRIQQLTNSYDDAQALLGVKPGDQTTGGAASGGAARFGGFQPGGVAGRFGGPPAAGGQANVDRGLYIDRMTQEDRGDDWEMKVELVVVIDPPPAPPTPAQPSP